MNGLLVGVPAKMLQKLQIVQNNAARLVMQKKQRDHVTPLMRHLHWLPVKSRIQYKVSLLTFKALNGKAPPYLTNLLTPYRPRRPGLRSANRSLLQVKIPNLKRTGGKAFSVVAPEMWNNLPEGLRKKTSVESFKSGLKTFLFRICYP